MSRIALALLAAIVVLSVVSIETANGLLIGAKDAVVAYFDWLFVGVATGTLVLVVLLAVHPRANVRLGADDDLPEFSRFSWFAMLFSAGLASGLLYWAAAEPILHFQANPLLAREGIEAGTPAAVQTALRITIFHWGFHGWAMYVLGGLAIGVYSYRHGRPLTIRSALYPVLGPNWIDRWPGHAVDLIALLGTVFGVATSIGLSAAALNATLQPLAGLPVGISSQIGIVFFVCVLGVLSAISGLGRGIRRLSEVNVWVSAAFLISVFLLGPTVQLLGLLLSSAADYLWTLLPMGLWLGSSAEEKQWQADWTVFYWGWWLAWMPFVSLFIARISKGRSVREFIIAVMGVPTLVIVIWMVVIGGTALDQELTDAGSISAAVNQDYSLGVPAMLGKLAAPSVALALTSLAAFLLFTWLITSLDSATLVICHLTEKPDVRGQQVLWGTVLAVVTATLIWMGGLTALQAASIVIGLPLACVMLLIGAGLIKDLISGKL
jgi:choline/glycine/proline betaine transport protein